MKNKCLSENPVYGPTHTIHRSTHNKICICVDTYELQVNLCNSFLKHAAFCLMYRLHVSTHNLYKSTHDLYMSTHASNMSVHDLYKLTHTAIFSKKNQFSNHPNTTSCAKNLYFGNPSKNPISCYYSFLICLLHHSFMNQHHITKASSCSSSLYHQ